MKFGKTLFKDSIVYGFVSYLSVVSALILTPIYTRMISKESYGLMELFNTWNNLIIAILPLGIITAVVKFYPEHKANKDALKSIMGNMFTALIILSLLYIVLSLLIKEYFIKYFIGVNTKMVNIVYWQSVFVVIFSIFLSFSLNTLRAEFKKWKYVIASVTNFLILSILGFVFVYFYNSDFEGFYRASVIAGFVASLTGLIFIKTNIKLTFNLKILKKIFSFSIHFVSVFILFQLNTLIDRYLINEFIDLRTVGVYSIANRMASMPSIVFNSFNIAWYPLAMSLKNNKNLDLVFNSVHKVFITISFLIIFIVWLFKPEILLIFAPGYAEAIRLILILFIAKIIGYSTFVYSLGLHFSNKTKYLSYGALFSVISNIIISISTVKILGVYGIAIGTLVSSLIWTVYLFIYSQKKIKISYENKFFILFILFLLIILVVDIFWKQNLIFNINLFVVKTIFIIFVSIFSLRFVLKTFKNTPEIKF